MSIERENVEVVEIEKEVEVKKETLFNKAFGKAKDLGGKALGKAKEAGVWIKENPVDAGMVAFEAIGTVCIAAISVAGIKSVKKEEDRRDDLYKAAKDKLKDEPNKEIYYVIQK